MDDNFDKSPLKCAWSGSRDYRPLAYQIAVIPMTLSDFQGHLPTASLLKRTSVQQLARPQLRGLFVIAELLGLYSRPLAYYINL